MAAAAAIVSLVSTVASTGLQIAGSIASGKAAKAEANAQAAAMEREAKRKQEASRLAAAEGDRRVEEQTREGARVRSNLRAQFAGSGFDTSSADFTWLDQEIAARSDYAGRLDAWDADMRARGYEIDANETLYGADVTRAQGKTRANSHYMSAVGAGVAGIGKFASKFGGYSQDLGWDGGGSTQTHHAWPG